MKLPLILPFIGMLLIGCASPDVNRVPGAVAGQYDRLQVAQSMFEDRCKTAGVKIHKVIDNVDSIFLMKPRGSINFSNQFELNDPYGRDMSGDDYLASFLRGSYEAGQGPGTPAVGSPPPPLGFNFVEAIDTKDGQLYRHTGSVKATRRKNIDAPAVQRNLALNPNYDLNIYDYVVDRVPINKRTSRYGITYDDISTHEEREYWIAGSSLKVVDMETNEIIAERIGYMIDMGQGSRAGGRSPWIFAADYACPRFQRNPLHPSGHGTSSQPGQTQYFVEKALKPSLANNKSRVPFSMALLHLYGQ
jgi:hypothetical protein